jgi:hypothetical protein
MLVFGIVHILNLSKIVSGYKFTRDAGKADAQKAEKKHKAVKEKEHGEYSPPLGADLLGKSLQNKMGRNFQRPAVLTVQNLIPLVYQQIQPLYNCRIKTVGSGSVKVLGKLPEIPDKGNRFCLYVPSFPADKNGEFLPNRFPKLYETLPGHGAPPGVMASGWGANFAGVSPNNLRAIPKRQAEPERLLSPFTK